MKIGLIGTRGHVHQVFERWNTLSDVAIAGLSAGTDADSPDSLVELCAKHNQAPTVFPDYRKMLDDVKPDVAVVMGPFEAHAKMCCEAFGRGIHVFCEKPAAITMADLAILKQSYARSKCHFSAMMSLRYQPAFYTAHGLVNGGAIGKVRLINAQKSYKLGTRPDYYKRRETYGGTIPWVGIHGIDILYWFAHQRFLSVHAVQSSLHNLGHGDLEMSALCQFVMQDEILASVTMDYYRPATAPSHGDDRVRVVGTDGVIEVRHGKVLLINSSAQGESSVTAACDRTIFADFIGQIRGGASSLVSAEDVFNVTEACLLARESADGKRMLEFPA